jgi:hypothetical protein
LPKTSLNESVLLPMRASKPLFVMLPVLTPVCVWTV